MTNHTTLGAKLLALKDRSGLSLANIARSGGYRNASSIQRYFSEEYDAEFLPGNVAKKLEEALVGFGEPPIHRQDIERLTEYGFMLERQSLAVRVDINRRAMPHIECNGSYPAGTYIGDAETFSIGSDPLKEFVKPDGMIYRPIDAIYVSTVSMQPKYDPGDILFFERERPAGIGKDAIFFLIGEDEKLGTAILARLISKSRDGMEVEILNPSSRITIPLERIDDVCPVLAPSELLPEAGPRSLYALA